MIDSTRSLEISFCTTMHPIQVTQNDSYVLQARTGTRDITATGTRAMGIRTMVMEASRVTAAMAAMVVMATTITTVATVEAMITVCVYISNASNKIYLFYSESLSFLSFRPGQCKLWQNTKTRGSPE